MQEVETRYAPDKSRLIRVLRLFSGLLPGEYLKTVFYLNVIDLPRRLIRQMLFSFYRYDHVYAVLKEFAKHCDEPFSVLEFGTSDGYSFVKLLYAVRYLKLNGRVMVHTFDSFEGMPPAADEKDKEWTSGDDWVPGTVQGSLLRARSLLRETLSKLPNSSRLF
jgi:hypothetical protein